MVTRVQSVWFQAGFCGFAAALVFFAPIFTFLYEIWRFVFL